MMTERRIGQYKLIRTLGAGGMGTVYLGEHLLLGKRAAIKTLQPALSAHSDVVERFFNEARAISMVSDPGVVQVFDFGYHVDGTAFIVMELLEGESLEGRIERLGALPLGDALRIARQLAASLGAAHDCGIVHRDLKPSNVFVIRDHEVHGGERTKLLDFGIAKLGASSERTQNGGVLGTPVYMSPEQCRTDEVDHRSDQYSLGCLLYHVLTGRPPFRHTSSSELIAAHQKELAYPPSCFAPDVPSAIDSIVMRCLAKDPDARFESMVELEHELARAVAVLSDPGMPDDVVLLHNAVTPLATGFRSAYDVNQRSDLTPPARPRARSADQWFNDSSLEVELAAPRTHAVLKRLAFVGALLAGMTAGLLVTDSLLDAHELPQIAPARVAIEPPAAHEEAGLRGVATAHEPPPPPEPPREIVPVPVVHKPYRPPRPHHLTIRPRALPQPTKAEDLYDTR